MGVLTDSSSTERSGADTGAEGHWRTRDVGEWLWDGPGPAIAAWMAAAAAAAAATWAWWGWAGPCEARWRGDPDEGTPI